MAVRGGVDIEAIITLAEQDVGTRIGGRTVYLQQENAAVGGYIDLKNGVTNAQGEARIPFRLPTAAGKYRYRSRWDGDPEFRADTSPAQVVDVV